MQRVATFMEVKPGMEERYREEHRNIWPEVVDRIRRYGIRNYTIFMLGCELYSFFEVEDLDRTMRMAREDPVNQRWQEHMAGFFVVGSGVKDGSTVYPLEMLHIQAKDQGGGAAQRRAALAQVKQGMETDFRDSFQNIPMHITRRIEDAGFDQLSIYLIGRKLFTYLEASDPEKSFLVLNNDPVIKHWQARLAPLVEGDEFSFGSAGETLEEVFRLD